MGVCCCREVLLDAGGEGVLVSVEDLLSSRSLQAPRISSLCNELACSALNLACQRAALALVG